MICKSAFYFVVGSVVLFLWSVFGGVKKNHHSAELPDNAIKRVEGTITVNATSRHYVLYVPENLTQAGLLPLVFLLHGARSSPRGMQIISEFQSLENKQPFITVYPAAKGKFWDDGRTNVNPQIDDVKFINVLIDTLETRYNINRKAVFAAGMSNGATMAVRLACQSKKIKAIATVASTAVQHIINNCRPDEPKPALFIKGTHDPITDFNGVQRRRRKIVGFREAVQKFRALDGCSDKFKLRPIPDSTDDGTSAVRKRYENCENGAEVVSIVVQNGGHTWPGAPEYRRKIIVGRTSHDFSASQIIWDFFKRHIN